MGKKEDVPKKKKKKKVENVMKNHEPILTAHGWDKKMKEIFKK